MYIHHMEIKQGEVGVAKRLVKEVRGGVGGKVVELELYDLIDYRLCGGRII